MKLYEQLVSEDIISPIRSQLDSRTWMLSVDEKGEPFILIPRDNACNSPWLLSGKGFDRQCPRWLDVYWTFYRFISKGCHSCFKVVFKPQNLAQAIKIHEIQNSMDLVSKCGMERRDYTRGEWNAFWYAPLDQGVDGGRQLFRKVRKVLTAEFGEKFIKMMIRAGAMILKHGCTEMEMGMGPSSKWDYEKGRGPVLEPILDKLLVIEELKLSQPAFVKRHIMANWIEWAYKIGDPTWSAYCEPSSFPAKPDTYHEDIPELIVVASEVKE